MKANKQNKTNDIPSLWVEWATMPWLGEAPLLDGGVMAQWRMEERESVGGLRDKGSQGIHGKHNSMQWKSCVKVTPHPPFIAFFRGFRVLSPWFRL